MQYSRVSPVARLARSSLSTTQNAVRHIAQVRSLHIQAPAALYTVGYERIRKTNIQNKVLFNPFRTYADKVVKVPQMAESISEGTLKQWVKKVGDYVHQDEEVATIETDKIDVTVNSPASGTIVELYANEEDNVSVGADFFRMELGDAPKEGTPKKEEVKEEVKEEKKEEVKEVKKEEKAAPAPPKAAPAPAKAAPAPAKAAPSVSDDLEKVFGSRNETRVKMNRMRLRIAERLKQSQETAASLTTFNEIDMTNLMKLRSDYKDAVIKKHGIKLGFMSAFVKASAAALEEIPAVNASIDGNEIVYHDFVDISVAVSTPKGLVTPVLRNVEDMNFLDVEKNIAELGKKARDNKITIEDMAGGTFTISNGGVFGSLMGTPIINLPQTAILGMHSIKDRPVAVDGKIEIRPMMYVALTYDHRLVDGREAVTFLVKIKELIEDPRRFLLDV